jgi:excisionase family DNA binding protein
VWQVAARLGVPVATVRRAILQGTLPAAKLAGPKGAYVVAPEAVEAFRLRLEAGR